jgi:tRNA pseudouridine55 synthase
MDGILNIYKEKGFTSHDVVAKLRGILHQKKIGHTGTLDPDAVGVLPVCLGKATKVCDLLTQKDKVYEAELLLGTTTDTQDMTGTVLEQKETDMLTEKMVLEAAASFLGEYDQIPPMYSALKVQGKKLYELAREGIEVERRPRRVQIFGIDDIEICLEEKTVRFTVSCSKGTYIRTLCRDIGEKLGCGGCMKSLKRTRAGIFRSEDAYTLAQVEQMVRENTIDQILTAVDSLFPAYPKVMMKEPEQEKLLQNGNPLKLPQQGEKLRIYHMDGRFAAIYEWRETAGMYFPEKMF